MAESLKLLMMGTGQFALPTFNGLLQSRHDVVGLATQPDRRGRGRHQHVNPMKSVAQDHGLPVLQPENVNTPESLTALRDLGADLFVVAAYGQIVSAELLQIPPHGAINVHASILPKYRGAAPIQHALLNGETETGVTVFQIEPRLDAGPILGCTTTPIEPDETYGQLQDRLAQLSVPLTLQVVDAIGAGTTNPLHQDNSTVSRAPSLRKADGMIPFERSAGQVCCHIRAVQPWPGPHTFLHRPGSDDPLRVSILRAQPVSDRAETANPGDIRIEGEELHVCCGDAWLSILSLQPAGKRAMEPADFLRGNTLPSGSRFGPA